MSRYKKRKKEGDERQLHSGADTVMTQIKQVRLIFYFLFIFFTTSSPASLTMSSSKFYSINYSQNRESFRTSTQALISHIMSTLV